MQMLRFICIANQKTSIVYLKKINRLKFLVVTKKIDHTQPYEVNALLILFDMSLILVCVKTAFLKF